MKVGIIDVDGHNFPNLPLMKLSAWHKSQGDSVEWYSPLFSGHCDIVYMSKVFGFTRDYQYYVDADRIVKGGSGYCIELQNGREIYHAENDNELPAEVEHIYPDYSLYPELTKDTAYGFLSRGCPNCCGFCHVAAKEGCKTYKAGDLSEFWNGQKYIKLLDPNLLACNEHLDLLQQLLDSGAYIDFTQGLDIRRINKKNLELINKLKIKALHFAWDNPRQNLKNQFQWFLDHSTIGHWKLSAYVLTNFDSTHEEDLRRVYTLRDLDIAPYIMIYDKEHAPRETRRLQRWVNNKKIFRTVERFEDYDPKIG